VKPVYVLKTRYTCTGVSKAVGAPTINKKAKAFIVLSETISAKASDGALSIEKAIVKLRLIIFIFSPILVCCVAGYHFHSTVSLLFAQRIHSLYDFIAIFC